MMDDLETLKVIKEKEDSINSRIQEIKEQKEREINGLEAGIDAILKAKEEELEIQKQKSVDEALRSAKSKAESLIRDAMARSSRMTLTIKDEEIEKYVHEAIMEYLVA